MSYQKIQKILEAEQSFVPQLSVKDVEVPGRAGQKLMIPSLVYRVGEALKNAGHELQGASKNLILAVAASIPAGSAPVVVPPPSSVPETVRKPTAKPAPPKPVIVKGAKPSAKPTPKPVEQLTSAADSAVIHRYQCAIATAQLLAAVSQLFEKDDWPGCEERRKKLNDLIDDIEKASTQHVNLSVKQIIRARTAVQKESNGEG